MHCSNHFCGANAIHPYHLPLWQIASALNPNALFESFLWGECDSPLPFPLWQITSAHIPNALFGKGGCRCADMVVAVVRKGWLPLFGNGGLQMPFATLADGICDPCRWHLRPLQMAFAHHLFRTSFTTTSEHRPPGFPNIVHHPFRTPTADTSNADYRRFERCRQPGRIRQADFSNIVCYLRPRGRWIFACLSIFQPKFHTYFSPISPLPFGTRVPTSSNFVYHSSEVELRTAKICIFIQTNKSFFS